MKKVFEITIHYSETTWGKCYAMVEAETKDEAEDLFMNDPWEYDWEGWEADDSEMRDWEVDSIDECPWATKKLQDKEQKASAFDEALDMVERIAEEEKEKSDD